MKVTLLLAFALLASVEGRQDGPPGNRPPARDGREEARPPVKDAPGTAARVMPDLRHAPGADLFVDGKVHPIRLTIDKADIERLRRNPRAPVRASVADETGRYSDASVHLKGAIGSFRTIDEKAGFTLAFNDASHRFHGLRKIHLNNSVEDETRLNELLGGELFRAAGIPAPRVSHAIVFLNEKRLGLYVLVEGFTEDFIALHFGSPAGRLYEPVDGHDVNQALDEKLRSAATNRPAIEVVSRALQEHDPALRAQRLQEGLDVDEFVSFMAMEMLAGHRDGYCLARNNFRVYDDPSSGRLLFLPHGMDQLFGRVPDGPDPRMSGVLARTVMETPTLRSNYLARVRLLIANVFQPASLQRRIDTVSPTIRDALARGERKTFDREINELKQRIAERHRQMLAQLAAGPDRPLVFSAGTATVAGWTAADPPGNGSMDQVEIAGHQTLHIRTAANTGAAWHARVLLSPGRYSFSGAVRTRDVLPLPYGRHQGAALRAGPARSDNVLGDCDWTPLQANFEIMTQQHVDLWCELRARHGEAWFDGGALLLKLRND